MNQSNIIRTEKIKEALFNAVAIHRGPVGYRDILMEMKEPINPETLSRWLRLKAHDVSSPVIKRGPGLYTIRKIQYNNGLGRFM